MGRRDPGGQDRRSTPEPPGTGRPRSAGPYSPRDADDELAAAVLDQDRHFAVVVGEPLAGASRTLAHLAGQLRRAHDVRRVPAPRWQAAPGGPSLAAAVVEARKLDAPVTLIVDDLDAHVGRGIERPLVDGLPESGIRLVGTIRTTQLELLAESFPDVAALVEHHRVGPTLPARLSTDELDRLPEAYGALRPSSRATLARSLSGAESVLRHLADGAETEPLGVLIAELAALWGAIGLPAHTPTPALVRMARATAPLRGLAPPTNEAIRDALTWATRPLEPPVPEAAVPRLLDPAPWDHRHLRPHPVLRAEATSLRAAEIAATLPLLLTATDRAAAPRVAAALLHKSPVGTDDRRAQLPSTLLGDRLGDLDVVGGVQHLLGGPPLDGPLPDPADRPPTVG